MLMPKRTKYRKTQRGWKFNGTATKGNKVSFGEYGMVSLGAKLITNRQIEAARRTITRSLKREGKIWIRIFPDKPYTKKPAESCWVTARQIEAARISITRHVKRGGKVWIRIFPDQPVTKKPAETRMGNGKGNVEYYVVPVKRGMVLFEISGVDEKIAQKAFLLARQKFPIPTKMIKRDIL